MRTSVRYALSFGAAFAICVLAFLGMMAVSRPLGPVLDAVSERLLSSLIEPRSAAEPSKEVASRLPQEVSTCDVDPVLSSLEGRDPIEAATTAVRQGNLVLLGVYSDGVEVPGGSEDIQCWADRQGVLPIPGTSDVILCAEHERLQGVARTFSAKYNDFLVKELRVRFPDECAA